MARIPEKQLVRPRVLLSAVLTVILIAAAIAYFAMHTGEHWTIVTQRSIEQLDFQTAERTLLREHGRSPDDPNVVQVIAEVYGIQGRHEEALEWLNRIPDSAGEIASRARLDGALNAMHLYRLRPAQELLARSIALNPTLAAARRVLCNLELNLMRPVEARQQIVALDAMRQATAEDICLFCVGDRIRYDPQENIDKLESFLRNEPDNPVIVGVLAHNYVQVNRRDDAMKLLRNADDRSSHPDAWRVSLGIIENQIALGEYDEAARSLDMLPRQADMLPRTWLARGRAWRELGKTSEAVTAFSNAQLLDPFDPEPVYVLSRLKEREGHAAEADQLLRRTKELQQLKADLDRVLANEQQKEPKLFMQIANRLVALNARREALLCLENLIATGQLVQEASELEAQLRQDGHHIPQAIFVAGLEELKSPVN